MIFLDSNTDLPGNWKNLDIREEYKHLIKVNNDDTDDSGSNSDTDDTLKLTDVDIDKSDENLPIYIYFPK